MKKVNTLAIHKLSLNDDQLANSILIDKLMNIKIKKKSPHKFKIEHIYQKGNKTQRLAGLNQSNHKVYPHNNLIERSYKKERARDKISYSASMRRLNMNPPMANSNWNGMVDYFNNIRREADMSTNAISINETTSLQILLKSYKEKEQRWNRDRKRLGNELNWLKEELKAVRNYICNQNPFSSNIKESCNAIVPAFIRAWNTNLKDEEESKPQGKVIKKKLVIKKTLKKRVSNPGREFKYLVSPEMSNKRPIKQQFYHQDILDSSESQFSDGTIRVKPLRKCKEVLIGNGKNVISGHKTKKSKIFSKCSSYFLI